MRVGKLLAIALVVCGLFVSSASAAFTASWTQVAAGNGVGAPLYPVNATTNDPQLLTMQTWDLHISTDLDWAAAAMQVSLNVGNFYKNAVGGNTKPNPAFLPAFPALEFSTYVSSPSDNGSNNVTQVLGGFPTGGFSLGDATSSSPGTFSASWGDLVTTAPGDFVAARLTFPLTSTATVLTTPPNASFTQQIDQSFILIPNIGGGGPGPVTTPEPATLGLLAIAGVFGLRRRA